AFRIAGRAVDGLLCLDEFLDLALVGFPSSIGIGVGRIAGLLLGLILWIGRTALGERTGGADQERKPRCGKVAQTSVLQFKQPSTHVFPEYVPAPAGSSS